MMRTRSRTHARVDSAGVPVLLADQDRGRWDRLLIRRGLAALERAQALAGDGLGPYALQAAIAEQHDVAASVDRFTRKTAVDPEPASWVATASTTLTVPYSSVA